MASFGRNERRWILWLLSGFLTGIAVSCIFPEKMMVETGFLDAAFLSRLRYLEINQNRLLLYILRCRLGAASVLLLLSAAGMAGIAGRLFLCWCGMGAGLILTVLSMRYGIGAPFLFLACMLPQQILLIPGSLLLVERCMEKMEYRRFLLPIGIIFLGCLLECYVNPIVIKIVTNFF